MATRVIELSKMIGVSNKTLVLFFAEKHPEFEITDPSKHYGKSFSWFPEDGHTMEEEIQAELDAFFREHPELVEKTKSKKAPAKNTSGKSVPAPAAEEPAPTAEPAKSAPAPAPVPPPAPKPVAPTPKPAPAPVPPPAMPKVPLATPPPVPAMPERLEKISDLSHIDLSFIASTLETITGKTVMENSVLETLDKDYHEARKKREVVECNVSVSKKEFAFFPLYSFSDKERKLFVKLPKNTRDNASLPYWSCFICNENELKNDLRPRRMLHFDSMTLCDDFFEKLKNRAQEEYWGENNRILKSFITFTLQRLLETGNTVVTEEGMLYFNTGLLGRYWHEILIRGKQRIVRESFPCIGECSWCSLEDLEILETNDSRYREKFDTSPNIAKFHNDWSDFEFNPDLEIYLSSEHICEDGLKAGRFCSYKEETEELKTLYNSNGNTCDYQNKLGTFAQEIHRQLDSYVKNQLPLLLKRNYRLAVPQYRPTTGKIQFLLPVYFGTQLECALVVERTKGKHYVGRTVLDLEMAYGNARLIAKPEAHWILSINERASAT